MSNTGKRWIAGIIVAVILIAGGLYWYRAHRPKLVVAKPLTTVGVGLYVMRDDDSGKFQITRVFPNSPAEKAGIVPGYFLNKVNNSIAETNSIRQLSRLLVGPVGSKVSLELVDTNGDSTRVELIRQPFINRSKAATP